MDQLQDPAESQTLSCAVGYLSVTYLGISISGRRPRKQDLEILIVKVRGCLTSWKAGQFSLGGILTLLNLVLSFTPMYWVSIFHLPS